jgi:hypothetical protein
MTPTSSSPLRALRFKQSKMSKLISTACCASCGCRRFAERIAAPCDRRQSWNMTRAARLRSASPNSSAGRTQTSLSLRLPTQGDVEGGLGAHLAVLSRLLPKRDRANPQVHQNPLLVSGSELPVRRLDRSWTIPAHLHFFRQHKNGRPSDRLHANNERLFT